MNISWIKESSFERESILLLKDKETNLSVEISVHFPTQFQLEHWQDILPDWESKPLSVVIVMQEAKLEVTGIEAGVEEEKNRLREKFIFFSGEIIDITNKMGIKVEPIDPVSGEPLLGSKGKIKHDDLRVADLLLNDIKIHNQGDCKIIEHPTMKMKNYPSVLLCNVEPDRIKSIIEEMFNSRGK